MPLPIPTLLQRSLYVLVLALFALSCETTSPAEKKNYTVSFDLNGTTGSITPQTIAEGEKVAKPIDPTRDGFTFVDWYTDEATTQAYDFATPITANLTLYAKWTADAVETFTVSFNSNGGSSVESRTVNKGEMADSPPDPSRENYRFDGWYRTANLSGDVYDFTTTAVAEDITLYAKWVRRYMVTFDTDNKATAINAVVVDSAAKVGSPEVAPNAGYTFDGSWYTSAAKTTAYNFDGPVISDTTLYAGLNAVPTYTVDFNSEGAVIDSKTVNEGDAVQPPTDPVRTGYFFRGWYTEEATTQAYDFATATVTDDITLYAKWAAGFLIPDVNFRTYLKERVGNAFEGELMDTTHSSVLGLALLDVRSKNISSLAGIEYFTALTSLSCQNNLLTALDVTKNTALISLTCSNNALTALDVTQNTALTVLRCYDNELTTLDVRQNTALASLWCFDNLLTALDVTKNTALTQLYCYNNSLTALDVRQNTALTWLDCDTNSLAALDVTRNTALRSLDCNRNQLTTLDVSNNTALTYLSCRANQLTRLDVSNNMALTVLDCGTNSLTELDVTKNTALTRLDCYNNSLTELAVTQNTALTSLSCFDNSLTELDVSQNTALRYLYCHQNQLTTLDLRGLKHLTSLGIDAGTEQNPLMQLYVHTDLQTHDEVKEAKTNRSTAITISTYNDANTRVCADFDPTDGEGTCKD